MNTLGSPTPNVGLFNMNKVANVATNTVTNAQKHSLNSSTLVSIRKQIFDPTYECELCQNKFYTSTKLSEHRKIQLLISEILKNVIPS